MEGTVKWFNRRKGYGFIQGDDGGDYFIHFTALPPRTYPREEDRVSFDAADTDRGKQAQNVKIIGTTGNAPREEGEDAGEHREEFQDEETEEQPAEEDPQDVEEEPEEKPQDEAESKDQ